MCSLRFPLLFAMLLTGFSLNTRAETPVLVPKVDNPRVDMLVDSIRQEVSYKKFDHLNLLLQAANQGNVNACNLLGWMFDHGVGVKQDSARAFKWFESCAPFSSLATYNMAVLYAEGRGTTKDIEKAMTAFSNSWSIGTLTFRSLLPQIPLRLAYYYRDHKKKQEAWEWAVKAADLDARHGKYLVARMILEKATPYPDDARAFSYLNDAVEAYSAPAASLLSWSYGTGRLTNKDLIIAHEYELIAARLEPKSQNVTIGRWGNELSAQERQRATGLASNWIAAHQAPLQIDFTSTLNGTEAQFSK